MTHSVSIIGKKRKLMDDNDDNDDNDEKNNLKRQKVDLKIKKGQPPKKGNRIEMIPSYYFFIDGYRFIAPYNFEYKCFAKGRWFNRKIYDVMTKEFVAYDKIYYKKAIEIGKILVRDKKVNLDYIVKNGDWISHSIHRHEPAILNRKIEIVFEDDDIMVVNKPSGIAIHPCGKYRYNTLIYILYNQYQKQLFSAHRLDRVTSGLLILCKNKQITQKIAEKIRDRDMKKTYLAKVFGKFPEKDNNELITVNQPIKCKNHQKGIHEIHKDGKNALTQFKFISYDKENKTSLVECYPKTGRTHQIRLHLQYLGYPIINDVVYGGKLLNSDKNKNSWIPNSDEDKLILINNLKKHWNENCDECHTTLKEINGEIENIRMSKQQEICLHSLKYECNEFCYTVPNPYWY